MQHRIAGLNREKNPMFLIAEDMDTYKRTVGQEEGYPKFGKREGCP